MSNIAHHIHLLNQRLSQYEQQYNRDPKSVTLVAVSKHQSVEKIIAAYEAGVSTFGENYLQEALKKIAALLDKKIEWHFIGPIQSNKTRRIAEHFDWVQSVTSIKIAKRLNDQRPAHLAPLNICLEVNISDEETKAGVSHEDLITLASYCLTLPKLNLRGLMAIPAMTENVHAQRQAFHQLHTLWEMLSKMGIPLDTLSMGMSQDFEAAVAEGSTMVRLGTAIFGKREP